MAAGRWGDLGPRVASAAVMLAVGIGAAWIGGGVWVILVAGVIAAMVWELARLFGTARSDRWPLGAAALAAAGTVFASVSFGGMAALVWPALVLAARPGPMRGVVAGYALAVMLAGQGLLALREIGMLPLLWLVAVVIASDVLGYFAGRILGGPKFWPAVSPKKTWSGTIAGWIGAALVGAGFAIWGGAGWALAALSVPVAFAGQMGDILESWLKRRAGVKDSSSLIPGHGGFLDRFDAVVIAALAVALLGLAMDLPLPGGR